MSDDSGQTVDIEELVDYCHTQAGLLSGRVETMRDEADDLLTEIDEEMAELRTRLEDRATGVEGVDGPSTPAGPGDLDLEELEELETEVEEKQLLVEAKQARMQAFQDLATAYTELATDLPTEFDAGGEALEELLQFEADHDAPAYFDERETLVEAAVDASEADADIDPN